MRTWMMLGLASVCLAGVSLAQTPSTAVVDLEELVRLHPNTASDKKLLEQTLKEFTGQKEQLQARVESTRKDFETAVREVQNPALSEKAKKKAEEDALAKRTTALDAEREFTETVRSLQRQLTEQEMRMLKRTTAEIEEAVAAYAKTKNLQLVLQLPGEKLGAMSGVIYAAPSLNITTNIMKLMGFRPAPAEEAPAKDEKPAKK